MARRKKNNIFVRIMYALLVVLIILLLYRINDDKNNNINDTNDGFTEKETKITDNDKNNEVKKEIKVETKTDTTKEETKTISNEVTSNSSNDEKIENKNESNRRGGNITLELIGEDSITVKLGSNYKDEGIIAYYSDGSDASDEVDVDSAVDTSKKGTYTVTYYAGNSTVIRRVTVE